MGDGVDNQAGRRVHYWLVARYNLAPLSFRSAHLAGGYPLDPRGVAPLPPWENDSNLMEGLNGKTGTGSKTKK